jgi:hypothetical protein
MVVHASGPSYEGGNSKLRENHGPRLAPGKKGRFYPENNKQKWPRLY